jgi:hypothetical protein
MLVQCRCGKKLRVNEDRVGKRIRCPACAEVFLAEPVGDDAHDQLVDDDLADDVAAGDGDEEKRSPGKKPKDGAARKARVSTRNMVGAAILAVLILVGAFLLWRKFTRGTLQLESTLSTVDIFIDGQKIDFPPVSKLSALSLAVDLEPGTHTVKITRDRYHPFSKEISVKSGQTELLKVDLKRIIEEPTGPLAKDFEGTWVLTYSNKDLRVYTVTAKGAVTWEQAQKTYDLSDRGDDLILNLNPGAELWKLVDGKLHVEPAPAGKPLPKQAAEKLAFGKPPQKPQKPQKSQKSAKAVGERKTPEELAEDTKVLHAFQGKWKITYTNNTQAGFTADAEGRLTGGRRLVRIKGNVLLDNLNGRLERLTLDGNQLKVEQYHPSSKYLDDPAHPQITGTAVRE